MNNINNVLGNQLILPSLEEIINIDQFKQLTPNEIKLSGTNRVIFLQEEINKKIKETLGPISGVNIYVTGSDGRMESGINLEGSFGSDFILYFDNISEDDKTAVISILDNIEKGKDNINFLEIKNIDNIALYEGGHSQNQNSKNLFFPSRFIDSNTLFGESGFYDILVKKFIESVKTGIGLKHIRSGGTWTSKIKIHKNISETGKGNRQGKEITHFDLNEGIINFQESRTGGIPTLGIKMGSIRYLQYKLIYLILKLIENNKIDAQNFGNIGSFTADKIDFVRNFIDGLDEGKIRDLTEAYYYFLKIHFLLQKQFKEIDKGSVKIELNSNQKEEFKDVLFTFNSLVKGLTIRQNLT
ncbi:MAG: hypothetical protein PHF46_02610 [Candidatus Gracilibacteria bacterium]|nr:hypothetical protein [Candidatus Gracilibacteria bacterium]MDD3120274.1 hypothetical protein [Candidatus Gracilibacteria bacterium]MDD4530169.1 hypothetical protein [Candidatus Gracilibacteria bacterium]